MQPEASPLPPKIKPAISLALPVFVIAVLGLAGVVGAAVVFFFNPSTHGFYPTCLFHQITGLNCPGCGGTRAVYALLHGHLLTALKDNALFVLALAALAGRGAWLAVQGKLNQPDAFAPPPKALWALLVFVLLFTVLRNLPAFAFLSP